jgi:hypothetical protein
MAKKISMVMAVFLLLFSMTGVLGVEVGEGVGEFGVLVASAGDLTGQAGVTAGTSAITGQKADDVGDLAFVARVVKLLNALLYYVLFVVPVVAVLYCAFHGVTMLTNPRKKDEAKEHIKSVIIITCVIFGLISIFKWILTFFMA